MNASVPRFGKWWRHGQDDAALTGEDRLRQLAKRGDTGAAIRLSHLADDRAETLRWLQVAVKRGDLRAALLIATMYHRPENWGGNYAEAFRYYRMAASSPDAQIRAAAMSELSPNGLNSGLVGPAASTTNAILRDVAAAYPVSAPARPGGAAAGGDSQKSDPLAQTLANIAEMRSKLAEAEKKAPSPKKKSATPQKKARKAAAPRKKKSPSSELETARAAAETGDAGAAFRVWELLSVAGRRDEAIPWLRRAAEGGHQKATYEMGEILERRGEPEEAEQWYRKAVSQDDDDGEAARAAGALGRILAKRGDRDEAKSLFQLAADRGDVEAQVSLGALHWQAGENEVAESCVREPAKRGHRRAMRILGNSLAEQGKYAEADRWLAKTAREGDLWAAFDLGEWLLKRGEFGKAKYRFRQAAKSENAGLAARAATKLRDAARAERGEAPDEPAEAQTKRTPAAASRSPRPSARHDTHDDSLEQVLAELEKLVGLEPVKSQVRSYVNVVRNQQQRRERGLKAPPRSNHLVFVGPPGTGKTTVARLFGQIFHALGMLENGEVLEVTRADLVAQYAGQTAPKTNEVIDRALGGVLFIDEAYTLAGESSPADPDTLGREAIDALMKRMEDDREKFVLIAAGYEAPMKRFLASNPGLSSRFDETIAFPDYDPSALLQVLATVAAESDYELSADAQAKAAVVLERAWRARDATFGNARLARSLFEDALTSQANRLGDGDHDEATLRRLEAADIPGDDGAPEAPVGEVLAELEKLVGLEPVKSHVRSYVDVVQNQQARRDAGLKAPPRSNHLVFVGPPGTGKTTVARLFGKIFHALGMLEHGEVLEVTRADLVAQYTGQTAPKTNDVIDRALGGVLFIDEAYTLSEPGSFADPYGQEAIDALMKRMEDDREKFVLIAAGYGDPMGRFLASNPGLKGRFDETIAFPDYDPSALLQVLASVAAESDYELSADARAKAAAVLERAWHARDANFGNARLARSLFEDAITRQATRLHGRQVDEATLRMLEAADIPDAT